MRLPRRGDGLPLAAGLLVTLILVALLGGQGGATPEEPEIAYTDFKALVEQGKVEEIVLQGGDVTGKLRAPVPLGPRGESAERFRTRIPGFGDVDLLPALQRQAVRLRVLEPPDGWGRVLGWGSLLIPVAILLWFFALVRSSRNGLGGLGRGGELQRFLQRTTREAVVPEARFHDVAGQQNAKREVQELVDYLRDPKKFEKVGAHVPRGVLLMGPPGTGKTLLARALAGEADVPFFSITGSEFIEVFVGVGAARVRNLFAAARKRSPCIIFIDELDAVGRTRGTGLGGGHDEREQTLNQILAELDGFEGHEAIIVLAATNRPDVLDPALLRPGRFDRHVTLDLPDRKDREAILRVHVRKVPLAPDIDLARIAATTPGFSGADLKNLVNEAAILSAREALGTVTVRHFEEARDKVVLGAARTLAIQPDEHYRLAVHESGHTLVAYYLPGADPLYKVSIIPRGRTLGGTLQLPEHERYTLPEQYLKDRLAVMLGGRAAEKQLLGSVSSGADNDIHEATSLARAMVARWGMSSEVGPVDLRDSEEHPFLGREIAQPRHFSESSAQIVDRAVQSLLREAEDRARQVIHCHRELLVRLVARLEEDETLEREQIESCLGPRPLDVPRRAAS